MFQCAWSATISYLCWLQLLKVHHCIPHPRVRLSELQKEWKEENVKVHVCKGANCALCVDTKMHGWPTLPERESLSGRNERWRIVDNVRVYSSHSPEGKATCTQVADRWIFTLLAFFCLSSPSFPHPSSVCSYEHIVRFDVNKLNLVDPIRQPIFEISCRHGIRCIAFACSGGGSDK